jgi:large subunit ribosomal protein L32
MPLPKRRHSNARTRKRRAHDFLTAVTLGACPKCNEPKRPHRVCSNCGYYGGRMVIPEKK